MRIPLVACIATAWLAAGLAAGEAPRPQVAAPPATAAEAPPREGYSAIVKQVAPSVVTVATRGALRKAPALDLPEIPGLPDLHRFFGPHGRGGRPMRPEGLGSGVIVSADGYIITNHHVVDEAETVTVTLANGYDEFTAKVVGSDEKSDLAVLRIEPGSAAKLAPIAFADSDRAEVGDTVLAIGNPMGVGQTVTMGIISALGRGVGLIDYEDFIQTDAAINPGNSGGALIDVHGRLVGVNTAILSRSGGNMGIGFAVPANLVRAVMDQIISKGKVVRGQLGVMIQPVTPELAKALKLPRREGALVGDVMPDSAAAKAGLKAGDVITSIAGVAVADPRQLRLRVAQTAPGTSVALGVRRDGKELTIEAVVQDQSGSVAGRDAGGRDGGADRQAPRALGVRLQEITPELRKRLELPERLGGALIAEVEPDSRAERAGLKPGDVVHEVDGSPVADPAALARAIKGRKDGLLLRVWSSGGSRFVAVPAEG